MNKKPSFRHLVYGVIVVTVPSRLDRAQQTGYSVQLWFRQWDLKLFENGIKKPVPERYKQKI